MIDLAFGSLAAYVTALLLFGGMGDWELAGDEHIFEALLGGPYTPNDL